MCVVSMVSDHYLDKWNLPKSKPENQYYLPTLPVETVSKKEFDELKKEVLEMKELLKKAIDYDTKNDEPECHIEDKVEILKKVAEHFGVTLEDVFK